MRHLTEPPILTKDGYCAAIGVSRDELEWFRAALFAYADYCKGMAWAIEREIRREGPAISSRPNCWSG